VGASGGGRIARICPGGQFRRRIFLVVGDLISQQIETLAFVSGGGGNRLILKPHPRKTVIHGVTDAHGEQQRDNPQRPVGAKIAPFVFDNSCQHKIYLSHFFAEARYARKGEKHTRLSCGLLHFNYCAFIRLTAHSITRTETANHSASMTRLPICCLTTQAVPGAAYLNSGTFAHKSAPAV